MDNKISIALKSLVIFRGLLGDKAVEKLIKLESLKAADREDITEAYCDFAHSLLSRNHNWSEYLLSCILKDENIYTADMLSGGSAAHILEPLLDRELEILAMVSKFDGDELRTLSGDESLAHWDISDIDFKKEYKDAVSQIRKRGVGIFSTHHMFILNNSGELTAISHPDPQRLDDMYGYEGERNKIIANTKALLEGKAANNVLLYGDAGTGKSSTVKAIVNEFYKDGLRLIELEKKQLHLIPELLDKLAANPLKFILFIDDLTFSSDDRDFCTLKAILEGGISGRGTNTVIYVTSNHRHLIKEKNSDRMGDEVSISDKIQEIVSLSARFGLTVTYCRPDKDLYCSIVLGLAQKANIDLDEETLLIRAEAHAIRNGGRNPRTAKQFIELLSSGVI